MRAQAAAERDRWCGQARRCPRPAARVLTLGWPPQAVYWRQACATRAAAVFCLDIVTRDRTAERNDRDCTRRSSNRAASIYQCGRTRSATDSPACTNRGPALRDIAGVGVPRRLVQTVAAATNPLRGPGGQREGLPGWAASQRRRGLGGGIIAVLGGGGVPRSKGARLHVRAT